jgi:nitroimidazol reductase NimA-like FMN-containing flavoprotein (pyridoxamine 5'-phosphate oxidase superfamily)
MRRSDREISDPAGLDDILRRARVVYVAMVDDGEPYVLPFDFGYVPGPDGGPVGGALLIHCAETGRKLDVIARGPRVCFTAEVDHEIVPGTGCGWTGNFRSVVGWGTASLVTDARTRADGLARVIEHYSGVPESLPLTAADGVALIRIDIERVTGKARPL